MATDPQSLLSQANCFSCFGSDRGMMELLKLALLKQLVLAENPMAATDAPTLLAQSNCYSCYGSSPGIMQLLELGLLAQLVNGQSAPSTPEFVSALLPLNARTFTVAHGLGVVPTFVRAVLVCQTFDATSFYNPGEEFDIGSMMVLLGQEPFTLEATATQVSCGSSVSLVGNETKIGMFQSLINSGGNPLFVSPTSFNNFKLRFYARP